MYAILEIRTSSFEGSTLNVTARLILPPITSTPAKVIEYGIEDVWTMRYEYHCENRNLSILHHHAMLGFTLVGVDSNPDMQNNHDLDIIHYYLAIPPGFTE